MIFLFNYLIALLVFVVIVLLERLVLLWLKKKPIWPLFDIELLITAIAYSFITLLFVGVLHIVFKKINAFGLVFLDIGLYLFIKLIRAKELFFAIKDKKGITIDKKRVLGFGFLAIMLLECFAFNSKAYSNNKAVTQYTNFVCEDIATNGKVEEHEISLTTKQYIYINTKKNNYDNIYLSFDNNDMNLFINIFEKRIDSEEYTFKKFALIDPKFNAFGYISLDEMDQVESIKLEFDIDDSRYLNNASKPTIIINEISFDSYFPMIVNPVRLGSCFLLLLFVFNFKKLLIDKEVDENENVFKKIEKVILFGGILAFACFIIHALKNNSAYFIKYDELYLGGTSSSNIYYQQFDAYVKGQLHLDVPVDTRLLTLRNPYNPYTRNAITVLWDHAFYNGKYYSYYGHAPIYLVMFPIYWISGYVPSNLFILQLGVLFSIFAISLAALEIIHLFIKKTSTPFIVLTLLAIVFGSLLLTNNTYEYGGMIYRIPYAYANGFLFLTIYLFIKGYRASAYRFLYFIFSGLSLVFIVLSRPLEVLYLFLFIPIIIKMIIANKNIKQSIIDYVPAIGVVLVGAVLVCIMNYTRFNSIFEFGEHYQLTVTDCTKTKLSIDGILPTIYHFFVQTPKHNKTEHLLTYRYTNEQFETHPYITCSVGLLFIPITALMLLIPFVLTKDDDLTLKIFVIASPIFIFMMAFVTYCFAGVCPRYLNDIAPWAALTGGLLGLKALEKDNGDHPVVPVLISAILIGSIILSAQYHFVEFDGLRVGDYNGLYSIFKSIFNYYNI